jgi:mannose-6-phosphate isomerase-like protein (cupin superfamily)
MGVVIKRNERQTVFEHGVSAFHAYPLNSTNLSMGISEINGRYPQSGHDSDTAIEQVWFVESGQALISLNGVEQSLSSGDMVLVKAGDTYWIDGKSLRLIVASCPPWTVEQHRHID